MAYLKFYEREQILFPEQYRTVIPDANVKKFAKKIARHFKVTIDEIKIRGWSGSGFAYESTNNVSYGIRIETDLKKSGIKTLGSYR